MDILLNGANAALHLAHDLRRDVEVGLLLLGPPHPPRFVRLEGFRLRNYQPDIRSNAALLRRVLVDTSRIEREISPGVFASQMSLEEALDRASGFRGVGFRYSVNYAWGPAAAWYLLFLAAGTGLLGLVAIRAAFRSP